MRLIRLVAAGDAAETLALDVYLSTACADTVRIYRGNPTSDQLEGDVLSFESALLPGGVGTLHPLYEMASGQLRLHFMTLERGPIPEVEWGAGQLALFIKRGLPWQCSPTTAAENAAAATS